MNFIAIKNFQFLLFIPVRYDRLRIQCGQTVGSAHKSIHNINFCQASLAVCVAIDFLNQKRLEKSRTVHKLQILGVHIMHCS